MREITLTAPNGSYLTVLTYGAVLKELFVPNKEGNLTNIVISLEDNEAYKQTTSYQGMVIGPLAGRLRAGHLKIGEDTYALTQNHHGHHLHGGHRGLSYRNWTVSQKSDRSLTLACKLSHLEEGYPGNRNFQVTYQWLEDSSLEITYEGTTDLLTPMSLTQHVYFNLNGSRTLDGHLLHIDSDKILLLDEDQLPTGEMLPVEGTPFDYKEPKFIVMDPKAHQQLAIGQGLDQPFVLKDQGQLSLYGQSSGLEMKITTTHPVAVLYTLNYPEPLLGRPSKRCGIAIETQGYPDACHHDFPQGLVEPHEPYLQKTRYQFSHG